MKWDEDLDLTISMLMFISGAICFHTVGAFSGYYAYVFLFAICFGVLLKLSLIKPVNSRY